VLFALLGKMTVKAKPYLSQISSSPKYCRLNFDKGGKTLAPCILFIHREQELNGHRSQKKGESMNGFHVQVLNVEGKGASVE
jgi:hypothetical protein